MAEPSYVGKLADAFPISRPAISQHLRVLERAGLVTHQTMGTRRRYEVDPTGFDAMRRFFDDLWSTALLRFKERVETSSDEEPKL